MSRFYEALSEANRIRQDSDGVASLWDRGIPEIDVPPAQTVDEAFVQPETDRTAAPKEVEAAPEQVSLPATETTLNGFRRMSTEASLDRKARLIPHSIDSAVIEQYRRLRTKLLQKRDEKPYRTLLVTSANPQEGKTVTVLNLGLSFAMLPGFKVLVIDGDLRRGSLGNWLRVPTNQPGLSDVVLGQAKLDDVVLQADGIPMQFMVRGTARVTDVHAAQFDVHFRKLAEHFDLVIVDSPPVNLLADVQLLASACQAVLLVARSFVTNRNALEKAVQELEPFNLIGTVLNAAAKQQRARHYYGYYRG